MPIAVIQAEDYEPYIGEDFVLPGSDTHPPLPFTLLEVTRSARQMRNATREPFTLKFRIPTQELYPQGMYRLTHKSFDYQEIFLIPSGQSEAGTEYSAYYN